MYFLNLFSGDYRIPTVALTAQDGSRLDVKSTFPFKGIVRGTQTESTCTWKNDFNGYQCTKLDHLMLIIGKQPYTLLRSLTYLLHNQTYNHTIAKCLFNI